nr:hypothetical protein [Anaerolineae bacterium]
MSFNKKSLAENIRKEIENLIEVVSGEEALAEIADRLSQIQSELKRLRSVDQNPAAPQSDPGDEQSALFESFVQSVKSAAKPGISLESG